MRIAIVNDLTMAINALRRVLLTVPDYQIAWIARDGAEAVTKCCSDPPDLILMDLIMPVMDGVEATRQIMQQSPCGILIVTASTQDNLSKVYQAMGYGALDTVDTPILGCADSPQQTHRFLLKIATLRKLLKPTLNKRTATSQKATQSGKPHRFPSHSQVSVVAIGSSTGGPKALANILSQLPENFERAIAIIQHVDAHFSQGFVEWLQQQTLLPVRLAHTGDRLVKGTVLVAGTNNHLYLKPDLTLDYTPDPVDYPYRPSVDVFFKSLAQTWKSPGTAILLTGMGRDGAQGLSDLKSAGWQTIAQAKESCVVYGMPKAAVELNAALLVLNTEAIAATLLE